MSGADIIFLEDLNLPALAKFASRRETEVEPFNEIVIDSERVIERAVQQGVVIKSVIMTPESLAAQKSWVEQLPGAKVYVARRQLIETFVGQRVHQCMIAIAERPTSALLQDVGPRCVYLNEINDTQNVGAIIRNAHAFNVRSIICDDRTCSPYARRSIRVSMGSVFWTKNIRVGEPAACLRELRNRGYAIVAAYLDRDTIDLEDYVVPEKAVLVIGNEYSGIAQDILKECTVKVKIPIDRSIDSLNAACASAIFLHHFRVRCGQ
jgi:tRNA G18 (ribose-2'-O)-methylase SpoU